MRDAPATLTPWPHRLRRMAAHARQRLREEDKRKHIFWSFLLMLSAALAWPPAVAVALVFALGLVKEGWDYRWGSGFCWWDILANTLGIAGAGLPVAVLHMVA